MNLGFLSNKTIANMLNIPSESFETAMNFVEKMKDKNLHKEKLIEIANVVKDYDVEQLNQVIDKIHEEVLKNNG